MDKQYEPFGDGRKYELLPPTSARVKELLTLELRLPGGRKEKIQTAQSLGLEPHRVIPNHTKEVEEDGEAVELGNDREEVGFFQFLSEAAPVLFRGLDAADVDEEIRVDVVREAKQDFSERAFGTSGGFGI